jgi:hypothetical protein
MKVEVEMETITCACCAVVIAANPSFFSLRREDHEEFYCLNGHGNYFPGKSEAEKLRDELAQEKRKTIDLAQQLDKAIVPKKRGRPRKSLSTIK